MPRPGQELASIDFESMLGGPLVAVVNAQAQSAMATVNFIKEVGFKQPDETEDAGGDTSTQEPIYVTFKYPKELSPYDPGDPDADPPVPPTPAVYQTQELTVPILTLLPIPLWLMSLPAAMMTAAMTDPLITSAQVRIVRQLWMGAT